MYAFDLCLAPFGPRVRSLIRMPPSWCPVVTGDGGEAGAAREDSSREQARWVRPEDRRKAVELLKVGEERVIRLNLQWVEVSPSVLVACDRDKRRPRARRGLDEWDVCGGPEGSVNVFPEAPWVWLAVMG